MALATPGWRALVCAVLLASASLAAHVSAQSKSSARSSPDGEQLRDAILEAGAVGDPSAAPAIASHLRDRDEAIRAAAAGSLGRLRNRVAVAGLLDAMCCDKKPFVRRTAAYALGDIGDPAAVAQLSGRLSKEKDEAVRAAIACALGAIGDPSAIDSLTRSLHDKKPFVRREAALALGGIGRPESLAPLEERLATDEVADVRRSAATALGQIGDSRAAAALSAAIRDHYPYVSSAAVAARDALEGGRAPGESER